MEIQTAKWSEFPYEVKATVQKRQREEARNKSYRAGLWTSEFQICIGNITMCLRPSEVIETLKQKSTRHSW